MHLHKQSSTLHICCLSSIHTHTHLSVFLWQLKAADTLYQSRRPIKIISVCNIIIMVHPHTTHNPGNSVDVCVQYNTVQEIMMQLQKVAGLLFCVCDILIVILFYQKVLYLFHVICRSRLKASNLIILQSCALFVCFFFVFACSVL